jgi:hypothetical protein
MAATVRTMFSTRQDVHTKFNRPDVSLHGPDDQASFMEIACTNSTVWTSPFRVRTLQSLIMVISSSQSATIRMLGQYRLDTALLWKPFSAILERRLQLTVRTLSQAVRTLSGILVITFYSNIRLGRKWRRWKANKILCKFIVQMAIKYRPDGPPSGRKHFPVRTGKGSRPDVHASSSVSGPI